MPRRLSDPEWSAFLNQFNVFELGFPPWGGIVEWGEMEVLVFIGPERFIEEIGETVREVGLTDVTDMSDVWMAQANKQYSSPWQVFFYTLPESLMGSIYTAAKTAGQITAATLNAAGEVVGAVTGPILGQLAIPLAIAAVILFYVYVPKPR